MSRWGRGIVGLFLVAGGFLNDACLAQDAPPTSSDSSRPTASLDELLLFFPSKHPIGEWQPEGLTYRDVWFAADDGTQLHGWYCPCDTPRAVILITHGNAGNIAVRAAWLKLLQTKLRVSTLMFDYRGYGRSEGTPTVEGILRDSRAARLRLSEIANTPESQIVLMGESLGGAVAVALAAEAPPRGLVLQSTFSSLKETADVHFPKLSWLVPPDKLNSATAIAGYRGPLLQSHGTKDLVIPYASGRKLFDSANDPKTFVTITGAGHNNWLTEDYLRQLDAFITRLKPAAK